MTTQLQELEARYNATQAEMTKLGEEIELLKKQEAEAANKVGLKKPVPGSRNSYWQLAYDGDLVDSLSVSSKASYYRGFASTNKAQAQAFYDAIDVMAELRTQPGIAVPDGVKTLCSVRYNTQTNSIRVSFFSSVEYQSVSPAFKTEADARAAIQAVGEERIRTAFKTLMFMTPESRGEV